MALGTQNLFTTISGTVGSLEFAQHRGATIIRNAKKPKTLVTWRTIEAQRLHALKIQCWKHYTANHPDQIDRWKNYATYHTVKNRFGQSKTLSAFQWFLKLYAPSQPWDNLTSIAPEFFPLSPPPANFWATLTAPSTLIVNADIFHWSQDAQLKILYLSDPILPTTNLKRLRHHHLINHSYLDIQSNFTALLIKRQLTYTPGQQVILTLITTLDYWPRSLPVQTTITVSAP